MLLLAAEVRLLQIGFSARSAAVRQGHYAKSV